MAGLLDGEGSIVAMRRTDGSIKSYRMHIANTHLGVLKWCLITTGVGAIHKQTVPKHSLDPKRPNAHLTYKTCWAWATYGVRAASVVRQILPFLQIKTDKALALLEVVKP